MENSTGSLIVCLAGVFLMLLAAAELRIWWREKRIRIMGQRTISNAWQYYTAKYSIPLVWVVALAEALGWGLGWNHLPWLQWTAVVLWGAGFALLAVSRVDLAESFRIGLAVEKTALKTGGVYRLSRNPMYVGVHLSVLGAMLYTLNPLVVLLGLHIFRVHHRIILSEEKQLQQRFDRDYADYCRNVRRYL